MPYRDPEQRKAYHKAYSKAWADANKDKTRAAQKSYYARNAAAKNTQRVTLQRRWNAAHPEEAKARRKKALATWKAKNPDKVLAGRLRAYGLTLEQYRSMLESQAGRCACCGASESLGKSARFFVDHDHLTGAVRGLLCRPCNLAVGHAKEDPKRLRMCADYIERHARKLEIV